VKATAAASEPRAEEAANHLLAEGGTAADALIAGFLAAAAERPGVLFCPLQALFAGPGAGARAFDGRARQPGRGLPRPRGAVKPDVVPEAALAATPASLGALALLHAYAGRLSLRRIAAPALERTRALGARDRGQVIAKVSRSGPAAVREAGILRPMLAAAGRTVGGLLSQEDLTEVRPESAPPREAQFGASRRVLVVPWPEPAEPHRMTEFVAVVDAAGLLAVLGYAPDDDGVPIPELGVTLPRDAVAVRRGIPRVTPGEPLPCPGPIALGLDDHVAFMALGVRSATPIDVTRLRGVWSNRTATGAALVSSAVAAAAGEGGGGVLRSAETGDAQKLSV
jgi:hypothetical protein